MTNDCTNAPIHHDIYQGKLPLSEISAPQNNIVTRYCEFQGSDDDILCKNLVIQLIRVGGE